MYLKKLLPGCVCVCDHCNFYRYHVSSFHSRASVLEKRPCKCSMIIQGRESSMCARSIESYKCKMKQNMLIGYNSVTDSVCVCVGGGGGGGLTLNAHAYCNHHTLHLIHNVLLTLNHLRQLGGWQLRDMYHGSMVCSVTVLGSTLRISHGYSGGKVLQLRLDCW